MIILKKILLKLNIGNEYRFFVEWSKLCLVGLYLLIEFCLLGCWEKEDGKKKIDDEEQRRGEL